MSSAGSVRVGSTVGASAVAIDDASHRGPWRLLLSQFLSNRSATVGATIIVILSVMALFAPQLAPHPYAEQDLLDSLLKPLSPDHLLGTDQFGRDVFSRIIWGARVSMQVGLIVTTISMVVGLVIGCLAGYYGGFVDLVLSNLIDLVWGFPLILVALLLVTVMGPGLDGAMIATGLVAWSGFARIVRGEVVALREWGFIVAAQALGAGDVRIILRHILPNMLGPVMVMASFTMAAAVIIEASLSFLGLGAQPPQPSWGSMLNDGRAVIHRAYWMAVFPGVAIAMLVLGFNLLGDGLRDVLDPRMRRR
ncbi:MAG: peptide/nickel transport system permease protein [Thermomicrobiales bacterium]|nr:peptide/nickel transport system permease protein [Thermomicrobiales bacterium]MEA2595968.1 peptide/nickel transport system permease protein [Thermomicrobiales bacterium]